MFKSKPHPSAEVFFENATKWKEEFEQLREIVRDSELTEDFKWMHPCYTLDNKNVVLIHGFKEYCALLFHKGALLKDPQGILIQQTANVQAARQIRFTSVEQINELEPILKAYIQEAIDVEKSGQEVSMKKNTEYTVPEEFQTKLDEMLDLKSAFVALTPGRQRAYLLHFSSPKQSKTRQARVLKCIPQILSGKGLDD